MSERAVVLTSGGLDSTTCLALALAEGLEPVALSFDYGQRHAVELHAARRVVEHYRLATHLVIEAGFFRQLGGSALTDELEVPRHEGVEELPEGIPVTYVPVRNLVFLSVAAAVAERHDARAIYIGVNAVDYSGYPDCRPEFVEAFERAANLASKASAEGARRLEVRAPLVELSKAGIVRRGLELEAPLHLTHSCYSPVGELACGRCDSCLLRLEGFRQAGAVDPIEYVER
jgi:7-cyano-7-deazaguanine synthase